MKKGFKPKLFTKKEWQDNRSRACKGSGVGKALDQWQASCPNQINDLDKAGIAKAYKTTEAMAKALNVAEGKCNKTIHKETIAGINAYKAKVVEYQGMLKTALKMVTKREALIAAILKGGGTKAFGNVQKDKDVMKIFLHYASQPMVDIVPIIESRLLFEKKKYAVAVQKYGPRNDYNIAGKDNKLLLNTFVNKVREDQKQILSAIKAAASSFDEMLGDSRHYQALVTYPRFVKLLETRFPIPEFSL